jgi:hypothetical protein
MRYVYELRRHGTVIDHVGCAAEIVRLYEENVRLEHSVLSYMAERNQARDKVLEYRAELEATERQVEILSDELSKCSKVNEALREALKSLLWYANQLEMIVYPEDEAGEHEEVAKARAALARAGGKT